MPYQYVTKGKINEDNKTLGVVLFLGISQPFLLLASVPFWLAELVTQST